MAGPVWRLIESEHQNIAMGRTRRVKAAYRRHTMGDAAVVDKHCVEGVLQNDGAQADTSRVEREMTWTPEYMPSLL